MTDAAFTRYICWDSDRIGKVFNREALSVERAEFLATHVPMRQIAYEHAPVAMTSTNEDDLLAELLRMADGDQHTFAIVRGIPGTGKSHLIRWLKERYASARPHDAVLLIERANTSLRGTLTQIIDSGVFDRAGLPRSLQRLQEAVTTLSEDALADNILDQIKTAVIDTTPPADLPSRLRPRLIETFLLDAEIRKHLKAESGPIQRIAAFFSEGRADNTGVDDTPGFEPDDFVFSLELRRRLIGYKNVRELADDLQHKEELRAALADYLNELLRTYAISRVTRLSAQDLREMFIELRRHLKRQGIELALFIEDITAFTGIDTGLIDVLITQHTGEGSTAFCRLTSVVGMTDSYYTDLLPDNFKQRASHRLSLSTGERGSSDLLQSSEMRAEFAARYLNAIRTSQPALTQWANGNATDDALPIACETCPVRQPCHAAFGTVALGHGADARAIGLYPFTTIALDTLYRGLREGYARTPRTFLFELIAYILTNHTPALESGTFPPRENELTPVVSTPSFNPPAHRQLVERQAGPAAARAHTLLLFWGDRHAHRVGETIGGVPLAIFRAFGIRPIEGASDAATTGAAPDAAPATAAERPMVAPQPITPAVSEENERFTRLIDAWMETGKLSQYDRFGEWLADFLRSFIDWQTHGIAAEQVKEYITQGRFFFEGQAGTMQRALYLTFDRSEDMRYVLQALTDLHTMRRALTPDQIGEHLVTLSVWARQHEARIVAYVREPKGRQAHPDLLLHILARNAVLLACLEGALVPTDSLIEQYHQVIRSCAVQSEWKVRTAAIVEAGTHPAVWTDLMKRLNTASSEVKQCRTMLLSLLNRPQGDSKNVRYLDAAALLRALALFNEEGWALPALDDLPVDGDATWKAALHVYNLLRDRFSGAVDACWLALKEQHNVMVKCFGGDTPKAALDAMKLALQGLKAIGETYPAKLDVPFTKDKTRQPWTADSIETLMREADAALALTTLADRAVCAGSGYAALIGPLRQRGEILQQFVTVMRDRQEKLTQQADELNRAVGSSDDYFRAGQTFQRLTALFERMEKDGQ